MAKEVNVDLYELLKECETGLTKNDDEVVAYVFIDFWRMDEFVKAVGEYWFDDGPIDVKMDQQHICIDLNEFIWEEGHNLSSYKKCFNEYTWKEYEKEILEMEQD